MSDEVKFTINHQSTVVWVAVDDPDAPQNPCRVYWGSHGCNLEFGHDGTHVCDCCDCPDGRHDGITAPTLVDDPDCICVARAPYYGPDTNFYGEDAPHAEGWQ